MSASTSIVLINVSASATPETYVTALRRGRSCLRLSSLPAVSAMSPTATPLTRRRPETMLGVSRPATAGPKSIPQAR
jgi:hypothetical protein